MYYTVIKHDGHLRTRGKCTKHEPQVLYFCRVFSNDQSVLSQCIARLRLLHLPFLCFILWLNMGFWPISPQISWVSSNYLFWENKMHKRERSIAQGFWYFARSRSPEFQVNPRNPAKFTKTDEIPQNSLELWPNTCRHNIFESLLAVGCWGCLLAKLVKFTLKLRHCSE